jgi:hypothetical protein
MNAKNKLNKNLFVDIPNTEEGREAIKTIRKYINRDLVKTIRTRGRGSRTKVAKQLGRHPRSFDQSLPLKHSERMTLYLDYNKKNPSANNVEALQDEIYNLKRVNDNLLKWKNLANEKISTHDLLVHINDKVEGMSNWKERSLRHTLMEVIEGEL